MTDTTLASPSPEAKPDWVAGMARFEKPNARRAAIQLVNTMLPYFSLIALMVISVARAWPYWISLLIALPAGGFLVRLFIFFHDCCHGSFLASRKAMDRLGALLGVLTFTPYGDWRHSHGIHHTTSGNLDRRGVGDVWTMTLDEYRAAPWQKRLGYRLFRHPLVMFGLGPLFAFVVSQRFPSKGAGKRQVLSVIGTDIALLAIAVIASLTIGLRTYLLVQMPVMFFAGFGGIWLFYVQHQFDPAYWARSGDWQAQQAAMAGSSFYKLPALLQWFSGNIGLHHIHHLRPRIPNYNLQECYDSTPEVRTVAPLSLGKSFQSIRLNLWDEAQRRLISFRDARTLLPS